MNACFQKLEIWMNHVTSEKLLPKIVQSSISL